MLSITVVLASHEYALCKSLVVQGGSWISTGRENFAGHSFVLPRLGEGLEVELLDFEAENATLKSDYFW
jgi:hypothetical protein